MDSKCRVVDHTVKTFIVTVRTTSNVGTETIKDLIEKKHEVVFIEETSSEHFGWTQVGTSCP